jgi:hypothetical protein
MDFLRLFQRLTYVIFAIESFASGEKAGAVETWENIFREKSRRRSRRRRRDAIMKAAVLALLFASMAAAIYIQVAGLPLAHRAEAQGRTPSS